MLKEGKPRNTRYTRKEMRESGKQKWEINRKERRETKVPAEVADKVADEGCDIVSDQGRRKVWDEVSSDFMIS